MPRGSMPGERRGGRKSATPNRRTILADRIMAVLAGRSGASRKERLAKLVNDQELPAAIRLAIAQKAFPGRSGAALDALFDIASDASVPDGARRKVAVKSAAYFLPKTPVNKRWRFTTDECGFAVNAEIARDYRAIDFELRALKRHPNQDLPEIAQRIGKLQARRDAIRVRLRCPCPGGYEAKQFAEDFARLSTLAAKREDRIALTAEEDAEEAHRKARFDYYAEGPELTARRRLQNLEAADNLFRKNRFFKEAKAAPLSRQERNDLWRLRWLYPPHYSKDRPDPEAEAEALWVHGHPFSDEKPAADGNFYPLDSKLRPAEPEFEFEEYADVPQYCINKLGQPMIFTDELPPEFLKDESEPTQRGATAPNTAAGSA